MQTCERKRRPYRIHARVLAKKPTKALWEMLNGDITLIFDDGEIEANAKGCILSHYVWEYHRRFPKTPMLKKHYFGECIANGHIQPSTFIKSWTSVYWDSYDAYRFDRDIRDELNLTTYQVSNASYNDLVLRTEAYVGSLTVADMVEVANHPRIREAVDNMAHTPHGVEHCYKVASDVIHNDPALARNRMVISIKAGLVNEVQALQMLVVRGYMQDIDTSRFAVPIDRGYLAGLRTAYQSLIESRSAALSLSSSQGPLQRSEYQSRRLQLQNMAFRNLHRGDCGSTKYLHMLVTKDEYTEYGVLQSKGNFKNIIGKYYLDDTDGKLKPIRPEDKHLIGQVLKLRSMVAGCTHEDIYGVCEICYGGLSDTLPELSNIGHVVNTFLMQKFGQGILSLKHKIGSAIIDAIVIDDFAAKYLRAGKGGNTYYFTEEIKKKRTIMVVPKVAIPSIVDLRDNEDYDQVNVARLSRFDYLQLKVFTVEEDGTEYAEDFNLRVTSNRRAASFTTEALQFIKSEDFEINDDAAYEIDLTDWPIDKPLLVLPLTQYSISDHADDVGSVLESTSAELKRREIATTATDILVEVFELTNSRMDVNLAIMEAVLYGGMVVSIRGNDYSLPKAWTKSMAGVLDRVIEGRGMTGLLCYEKHSAAFARAENFINDNPLDHPMDVLYAPAQAIAHEKTLQRP